MMRHRAPEQRGFTLLEVMVALAIVAVALLAALRVAGQAAADASELRMRMLAGWVAGNLLAEHRARGDFPPPGVTSGAATQAGIVFRWREEVMPTPSTAFERIDVTVFGPAADASELARLTGFVARGAPR